MAHTALLALVTFVCLISSTVGIVYPTATYDGWEVILLDQPSNLFMIETDYTTAIETFYVFGGALLRVVTGGSSFTVQDHPTAQDWYQPFISVHLFYDENNVLWAIGPTNPSDYTSKPEGYSLPIALAGMDWQIQTVSGLEGYILFNVFVDSRDPTDVLAYLVGWVPVVGQVNETLDQVSLGLVRLHVDITQPFAQRQFYFNSTGDVISLKYNNFYTYSHHMKPMVHYNEATNLFMVVDPPSNCIYTATVGPGNSSMSAGQAQLINQPAQSITSSVYHNTTNLLYIGFAASGTGNGSIIAYEMSGLTPQASITFSLSTLANPRALAFDHVNDELYVAFSGGNAILQLNHLLNVQGIQRAPDNLTLFEAGKVGADHVYFITNEQFSKVVRVNKMDFCPTLCPYNGYCSRGKCVCGPSLVLSADGTTCSYMANNSLVHEKGAAIALGVLFALTVVIATVGWTLFWRARKGGYQSV